MNGILRISEAASLALHAMYFLASDTKRQKSVREISSALDVSGNHLAKVLQELTKGGLVKSIRGPAGGFLLARNPSNISLLEIYESVQGKVVPTACLLRKPVCNGCCIMGNLLQSVDREVYAHLQNNTLSDFVGSRRNKKISRRSGATKNNFVSSTDKTQ